jgi:methylphosphotriester-DNA--protein-cysteine methyltransferase
LKIDYLRFNNKKEFEDMVNHNPYNPQLINEVDSRHKLDNIKAQLGFSHSLSHDNLKQETQITPNAGENVLSVAELNKNVSLTGKDSND